MAMSTSIESSRRLIYGVNCHCLSGEVNTSLPCCYEHHLSQKSADDQNHLRNVDHSTARNLHSGIIKNTRKGSVVRLLIIIIYNNGKLKGISMLAVGYY